MEDKDYLEIEPQQSNIIFLDDEDESEELLSESQKKAKQSLYDWIEKENVKNDYRNMYKSFSNFPSLSKKTIYSNLTAIGIATILFCLCVLGMKYRAPLVFAVYILALLYFGFSIFTIFYRLRNANFIVFTGKITESFVVGSKLTNDKHFVLKLVSDDGKELAFHYYDKKQVNFEQELTLFIQEDATVDVTNYGPTISTYIEVIPTAELDARFEFFDKNEDTSEISAKDYIDN